MLNTGENNARAPFIEIQATNVEPGLERIVLMGGSNQLPSQLPADFFPAATFKIPYDLDPIGNGVVRCSFELH